MKLSKILIQWYLQHKRALPWRKTVDPYHVWLSEIILQQTRVAQGLPYYTSFIENFPSVFDLASAEEEQVLKLWQGLGYYSRARNLHHTAKQIVADRNGVFPTNYKDLLTLKGVGDYTASAIASFCYKEVVPVVDGNVYRVLSRYFGIETPINTPAGVKEYKQIAKEIIDQEEPDIYNQAIMEFGSLQCKPKSPDCTACPIQDSCVAFDTKKVDLLPIKLKKLKIKKRYFSYLVFLINDEYTLISQRTGKGIWQSLYEFPLIETTSDSKEENIITHPLFIEAVQDHPYEISVYNDAPIIHKLSHQHIFTQFYIIQLDAIAIVDPAAKKITIDELTNYPMPVLITNFMKAFFKKSSKINAL